MDEPRQGRTEKVSIFAKNLIELRDRKGLTTPELADALEKSVSHTNNLLNGTRTPSSDVLCAIAAAFDDVSFADAIYMLVDEKNVKVDEKGKRDIHVFKMNNGRGPTAGVIKKVTEHDLERFFGDEYRFDQFFRFLKIYMEKVLYKDVYDEYLNMKATIKYSPKAIQQKIASNDIMKDIFTKLYTMSDSELMYFNGQVDLYMKSIRRHEQ